MTSPHEPADPQPEAGSLPYTDDDGIGGPEFVGLIGSVRAVQDSLRMAVVSQEAAVRMTQLLESAAEIAWQEQVAEGDQAVSRRPDMAGRGNSLAAPFVVVQSGGPDDPWAAEGVFTAAYVGRGAVHGGWVTHLFDELMGRLAEFPGAPARTAYLNVNFRDLTPIDRPLRLEYQIVKRERRKIIGAGRLLNGDTVTADAEGLWVMPRGRDQIN